MWILAAQLWGLSPVLKCGPHTCGHLWLTTDQEHLEEAVPHLPDTQQTVGSLLCAETGITANPPSLRMKRERVYL